MLSSGCRDAAPAPASVWHLPSARPMLSPRKREKPKGGEALGKGAREVVVGGNRGQSRDSWAPPRNMRTNN